MKRTRDRLANETTGVKRITQGSEEDADRGGCAGRFLLI